MGKADRTARILIAEAERPAALRNDNRTGELGLDGTWRRNPSGAPHTLSLGALHIPRTGLAPGYLIVITISWRITATPKMTGQKTQPETSGLNVFSVLMIPFSSVLCSMTASLPGLGVRFTTGEAQGWALVSATDRLRQRGSAAGSGLARARAAPGRCLSGETSGASSYDDRLSEPSWAEYQTRRYSIT